MPRGQLGLFHFFFLFFLLLFSQFEFCITSSIQILSFCIWLANIGRIFAVNLADPNPNFAFKRKLKKKKKYLIPQTATVGNFIGGPNSQKKTYHSFIIFFNIYSFCPNLIPLLLSIYVKGYFTKKNMEKVKEIFIKKWKKEVWLHHKWLNIGLVGWSGKHCTAQDGLVNVKCGIHSSPCISLQKLFAHVHSLWHWIRIFFLFWAKHNMLHANGSFQGNI